MKTKTVVWGTTHEELVNGTAKYEDAKPKENGFEHTTIILSREMPQMTETVRDLIIEALTTDGAHHKQWYLEQIAKVLGIDFPYDLQYEKGIAP